MVARSWILLPVILLCLILVVPEVPQQAVSQAPQKPNILLVLTDDQDTASVSEMPNLQSELVDRGTTFSRSFVTTALCCPSRASILRGQYAHNHKVWSNLPPDGGFVRFKELDHEGSTVATWLDEAGYHTGYIGKYFNEYGSYGRPTNHVPSGWDRWIGYEGGPGEQSGNGAFKVNDQGKIVRIDPEQDTDYFARQAETYIENRKAGNPWFLVVATNTPHMPALASGRNDGSYAGRTMPKTPAFNEADISDKAAIWQENPPLSDECPPGYQNKYRLQCTQEAEEVWRDRMESLMDVDDMVGSLLTTLREKDFMQNTYIIFTSDNGFALYSNRIFSKGAPYEPSQRVPLIIRGPGVSQGQIDDRLVANIDFAPTFAQWAGARTPDFVDGRSLVPILGNADTQWRTRLLFEHHLGNHDYEAVRTNADQVYIEYPLTDETEYYDLTRDPYQLDGKAEAPPPELEAQLRELAGCAGASCRAADGGP
jgi:N-acetylglucosamine-6-sulfatase